MQMWGNEAELTKITKKSLGSLLQPPLPPRKPRGDMESIGRRFEIAHSNALSDPPVEEYW